jgi:hypothetical protein
MRRLRIRPDLITANLPTDPMLGSTRGPSQSKRFFGRIQNFSETSRHMTKSPERARRRFKRGAGVISVALWRARRRGGASILSALLVPFPFELQKERAILFVDLHLSFRRPAFEQRERKRIGDRLADAAGHLIANERVAEHARGPCSEGVTPSK